MKDVIAPCPAPPARDEPSGRLTPADRLLRRATAEAGIGAWACDLADDRLSWTPGVHDLFGLPQQDSLSRSETVGMYEEDSREAMERLRAAAIDHHRPFTLDAQIVRADGTRRWMRLTGNVLTERGRAVQLYGLKQDVTEEKTRWDALRRLAEHDALTGLASRMLFQHRFLDAPRDAPLLVPLRALILLDVDNFKRINDGHGHAAGDMCLAVVAERLSTCFADALMIARIGGDEFALLVRRGASLTAIEAEVARHLAYLAAPIPWGGQLLHVTLSAGVAVAAHPFAYDAAALFAEADAALYGAKAGGRNRVGRRASDLPVLPGANYDLFTRDRG